MLNFLYLLSWASSGFDASSPFCLPNDASDHTLSRTLLTWDKRLSKYGQRLAWAIYHSRREFCMLYCIVFLGVIEKHVKNSWFVFHQGFQTTRNNKSTRPLGLWPRAFICFSVFGTPDETLALVFDILLRYLLICLLCLCQFNNTSTLFTRPCALLL